jgi:hypothetical protein
MGSAPQNDRRYALSGLACLVLSVAISLALGRAFEPVWAPEVHLRKVWTEFLCNFQSAPALNQITLFATHANWVGVLVLEITVAGIALACSLWTLWVVGRSESLWKRVEFWSLVGIGAAAIFVDAREVIEMRAATTERAFLTQLLASLPGECESVRTSVTWARFFGEPTGISIGVAMAATATFALRPSPSEVSKRLELLQRLLYLASLLFVAGILMSRANFSWVLAHWKVEHAPTTKALTEVVKGGVLQSGVGYSALLAIFFLPVRMLLASYVDALVPTDIDSPRAKRKWLAEMGLAGSWQKDARQVVALLAPIVSAPIFDAIAKL